MFSTIKNLTFLIVLALVLSSTVALGGNDESGDRRSHLQKRIDSASVRTSIQIHDSVWEYYDEYKLKSPQKAIYIAVDDPYTYEGWAGGHGTAYDTLSEAKSRALDECNDSRADWNISEPCILFAENDNFVYGQVPAATSCPLPTLSLSTFAIFIPAIQIDGYPNLWVDLKYSHESNGTVYWQLNGAGVAQTTPSCSLPTLSLSTFAIFIPAIQADGYPNLWVDLKYSHETNGTAYWQLNGAGLSQ